MWSPYTAFKELIASRNFYPVCYTNVIYENNSRCKTLDVIYVCNRKGKPMVTRMMINSRDNLVLIIIIGLDIILSDQT